MGLEYGLIMAQGILSLVVPVTLALIFEKYIVRGLTDGAVKG
jgi:ABC-type glycerol-3-phosphate transport system permease component